MAKKFVRVLADLDCEWEGLNPVYRVYVNDEMFAERTWVWSSNDYLEEMLQIEAEPGEYTMRFELVPPHLARLTVKNLRIDPILRQRTDRQGASLWEIYERDSGRGLFNQAGVTQQAAWAQAEIQLRTQGFNDFTKFNIKASTEPVHIPAQILEDSCTLRITA